MERLRNAHWQLLAIDTDDDDPFGEERAMTWLRDGTGAVRGGCRRGQRGEAARRQLHDAGARKTVLLSHHPLAPGKHHFHSWGKDAVAGTADDIAASLDSAS